MQVDKPGENDYKEARDLPDKRCAQFHLKRAQVQHSNLRKDTIEGSQNIYSPEGLSSMCGLGRMLSSCPCSHPAVSI